MNIPTIAELGLRYEVELFSVRNIVAMANRSRPDLDIIAFAKRRLESNPFLHDVEVSEVLPLDYDICQPCIKGFHTDELHEVKTDRGRFVCQCPQCWELM